MSAACHSVKSPTGEATALHGEREFDIILFGATGYTGRLCAEYLASKATSDHVKWAIAGRSEGKLKELKSYLQKKFGDQISPPDFVIPSVEDSVTIQLMAARTKVLISAAGPFLKCGEPILRACVNASTDYVDLTAELPWVQLMAQKYAFEASRKGLKIIPCCGYDFVPNDMMMHQLISFLNERATSSSKTGGAPRRGLPPAEVVHMFDQSTPGLSGGTAHSGISLFASLPIRDILSYYMEPFFMCNVPVKPELRQANSRKLLRSQYVPENGKYCSPFVMSSLMQKYIHWSNELQDFAWGTSLVYTGGMVRSSSLTAWLGAVLIFIQIGLVTLLSRVPLFWSLLPQQGTGPAIEGSPFFESQLIARVPLPRKTLEHVMQDRGGEERVTITWRMDTGEAYKAAAMFAVEAAKVLCDSQKRANCPPVFGVSSPSASLGNVYLSQLQSETPIKMTISQAPSH